MNKIEKFEMIHGCRVGIILIFDDYSQGTYKKEFKEFIEYQKKRTIEDPAQDTYFKFYSKIKEFKEIPYDYFKTQSANLFSKVIFYNLRQQPAFLLSDELNIQIRLVRDPYGAWEYSLDASDIENACFLAGGRWFIQTIAAPYFYFQHIDDGYITRFFTHELTHQLDNFSGWDFFENKFQSRIKIFARKKSAYCLNFLYTSIFNLREEGFPDFNARLQFAKFDINMEGVHKYNSNLVKLTKLLRKKDSVGFYENNIGWNTLTPQGEYTNGRIMCTTIAMFFSKIENKPYTITINGKKLTGSGFANLDSLLSTNKLIYVSDFSPEILSRTVETLKAKSGYPFVKLYEDACAGLGISDNNQVMNLRRLKELAVMAVKNARQDRRNRARKYHFSDITPTEIQQLQ
jgi:hypothetical protein